MHSSPETIKNKILCYRKRNLLTFNKGFGHQVFNICCKYNAINIWHGIVPEKLNPLHSIKKIIIAANLRNDLQIGRVHTCSFSTIFLSNPFIYQKNYHIPEPFDRTHYSRAPNDSPVLIKALLDPNSYMKECQHCGLQSKDICTHLLTQCQKLVDSRNIFHRKLSLYNYPHENFPQEPPKKNTLLTLAFGNNCWRKCLVNFLKYTGY